MARTEQKLALIKTQLQMPLAVRDLLVTQNAASDESLYAMHEIMSNFKPDEALLCSAFIMKEIAYIEKAPGADLVFLHMECDRIIERYVARRDMAEENVELWLETEKTKIQSVSEDIETFLELVELCYLSYDIINPKIAEIIGILNIQLQSQMIIVDHVIALQKEEKQIKQHTISCETGYNAQNVIMFPSGSINS